MDLFDKCRNFTIAKEIQKAGFYPFFIPIEGSEDTEVYIEGKKKIMIGSNNYLGVTHHPKILEAANKALFKYGSGCTGSRLLNGTLDLHIELEDRLAKFLKKEAALVFSTGYQTNLGIISTLIGKDDVVFIDKLDHASIVDACRLSFGEVFKFKHNDMEDLERLIKTYDHKKGKLIVVDGIFSMEGDIANIPEIIKLAKKYNCKTMIDDAHSLGVLGKNGAGAADHFDVLDQVDLIMGTFSKSFGSIGGFVAGDEVAIHYIKHFSRSFIFSASMPPSVVATVIAALDVIENEPERRENLWRITNKMLDGYKSMGFDTCDSVSPVIPIVIGEDMKTFMFWKELFDAGVYANAAVSPAVPPGAGRMRTSYIATHNEDQMDFVLSTFEKLGKKLGVI
ncbi:aminotransferase class I/II-fold pyridoxal phosphate-dependent enzyme [candidate division KSB1 bacterium]